MQWKPIAFAPGYEISDNGVVRSKRSNSGKIHATERILRCGRDKSGYFRVALSVGGVVIRRSIHVLVLEAFVGPRPPRMHGCHTNGDPADNRLENLRWDTASGNNRDKEHCGTWQGREANPAAVLTEDDVAEIRRALDAGESGYSISKRFGVAKSTIYRIKHGKTWAKNATIQPS